MSVPIPPFEMPLLSSTIVEPEIASNPQTTSDSHYVVLVYDNDFNTMNEVMGILMRATGCTEDEAFIETWEIHYLGKSVVHHGEKDICDHVAEIIRTIGIEVDVVEE
jgi:ATP-dependent Clp protease adapter protein ClpS